MPARYNPLDPPPGFHALSEHHPSTPQKEEPKMSTKRRNPLDDPGMPNALAAAETAARLVLNGVDERQRRNGATQSAPRLSLAQRGAAVKVGETRLLETADGTARRLNAAYDGDDFAPETNPQARPLPGVGRRIASLVNVVPVGAERVHRAKESGRTQGAAPTDYGTALPESTVSFDSELPGFDRVGSYVRIDAGVWEDKGIAESVVRDLLDQDVARAVDQYLLNRATDGIYADSAVSTAAKVGSRFDSIVSAAATVRGRDYVGPLTAIVNPTDAALLLNERDEDGERFYSKAVLDELGVQFALSSVAASGQAVVGDLTAGIDLFVRQGLTIDVADSDQDAFLESQLVVRAQVRAHSKVQRPSALLRITSF